MPLTYRTATDSDWPSICRVDGRNFGGHYTDEDIDRARTIHDTSRFEIALDGKEIVGVVGAYSLSMTLPGGAKVPMGGLTWVSTSATHRRRGILTELMARSLADIDRRGEPVACLGASEGGIYERFGFGVASYVRVTSIDRRAVQLQPQYQPAAGTVRFAEGEDAVQQRMRVWARFHRLRAGECDRTEAWHRFLAAMGEQPQGSFSPTIVAVHRDGFVAYRIEPQWNDGRPNHRMRIVELVAITPEAHAALWHTVLGVDLVGPIISRQVPIDDPLPYLLTDPRGLQTTGLSDGTWVNVRDMSACFGGRTYGTASRVVVEVDGERWAIDGGPDGATCRRVRSRPDLMTDHASVGALLLGGVAPSLLAAGRRLTARSTAALRAADAFFVTSPAPHNQTLY